MWKLYATAAIMSLGISYPALADWQAFEGFGGRYYVSDPDTNRAINHSFKTEKAANKAARKMNRGDKKAEKNEKKSQ